MSFIWGKTNNKSNIKNKEKIKKSNNITKISSNNRATKNDNGDKNVKSNLKEEYTNKRKRENNNVEKITVKETNSSQKKKKTKNRITEAKEKLRGSKFRWLNEKMYTTTGNESLDMIKEEPELFMLYHDGFSSQVKKWPVNPVDIFIKWMKKKQDLIFADFGCGDAKIARSYPKTKVHSFDLYPLNEYITVSDSSHVPLEDKTVDVSIFSLSLMGINFIDFIREAHRVLKDGGRLWIAEVVSRFEGRFDDFIDCMRSLGFDKKYFNDDNKMFVLFKFVKSDRIPEKNANFVLKACKYKKR